MKLLLIFIGGGLGALTRFGLSKAINDWCGLRFPLGILACNILGCFLIGWAAGQVNKAAPEWLSPLVTIGFLGGLTTFSTFANDSVALFKSGESSLGLLNIFASLIPCLLAVLLGLKLAEKLSF